MKTTRRSRLKLIVLVLVTAMLLTMVPLGTSLATVAGEKPEKLGEFEGPVGGKPDISEAAGKKEDLTEAEQKMSSAILQLADSDFLPEDVSQGDVLGQLQKFGSKGKADEVFVYIRVDDGDDLDVIAPFVSRIKDRDDSIGLAAAWVDIASLGKLAALDEVVSVREVIAPVVYAGSEMTEGDVIHNSDDVRSSLGADGTGVKIGIISDGVDNIASAKASGDLPSGVTVLSNTVGGDEGTAMLEIVHDMAPGADLYFHDCGDNTVAFTDAFDDLVAAGCDVICDDIGWIAEPFFEDGDIASHIDGLTSSTDVIYVSSAGNAAQTHHQGMYYDDSAAPGWADMSHGGSTGPDLYTQLPNGGAIIIILQWDDEFGSSGNDYDLYLFKDDYSGMYASSTDTQNGNDDPIEGIVYVNNTGSTINAAISVEQYSGSDKTFEIYTYYAGMYTNNITAGDSIFGHPAVPGVIACGAIDQDDSGNNTIEGFSSRGPITMIGGTRQKTDITGIDGVSVTGAGGFGSYIGGNYYFYGTSAAAPHIAAIAAQLWSLYPSQDADFIEGILLDNAVDLGSAGYDNTFGYGRADAYASAMSYMYDVDFDSQGGAAVATQLVALGENATKPVPPLKADKIHDGWFKESGCTTPWSFNSDTVTTNTTLYAKWIDWVAYRDQMVNGKLQRTYYHPDGSIDYQELYYGADDSSVIEKINYYTDGVRTSYRFFDESGNLVNLIELYSNGNPSKVNYYNVGTGLRYQYKLYDIEGRMTHFIFTYPDGVKPEKTNYYNVDTGLRYRYKLYDTLGRTTHLIETHPAGIKPAKTNYYDVLTDIRTHYKLYDTLGRTTHYAECYDDGIKAKKMNYYNVDTGIRSAYKTYREDGSTIVWVECDSAGDPWRGTYYDDEGNITDVVYY